MASTACPCSPRTDKSSPGPAAAAPAASRRSTSPPGTTKPRAKPCDSTPALTLDDARRIAAAAEADPPAPPQPDFAATAAEIRPADLRQHVEYLASSALEGRLTGTRGEQLATAYVASVMEKAGLLPFGDADGWFEPFEFTAGVALGPKNALTPQGIGGGDPPQVDAHWRPMPFSDVGEVAPAGIVFAGYGVETPDSATGGDGKPLEPYSSYAHLDVKDQWVMVFRYLPEGISKERRNDLVRYASLRYKALTARRLGARGLIVVSGPDSQATVQVVPRAYAA